MMGYKQKPVRLFLNLLRINLRTSKVMKAIRKRLKAITLFLTVLLLFQSCVVYHKTPTTLEKAAQEQIKTKVTNTNGDIFKYKYITLEEGQFYGVHEPEELGEFVKV